MPNNVIYPRPQFQNSSGAPLAGGTLSTYISGTSTPKVTYPTEANLAALTSPNPAVMTLNSNGTTSVDLWLNGSYKFVVADSAGAIVYTSDNINDPSNILDASGNIILGLSSVGSYNYISLSGALTGVAPVIAFKGGDTNVNGSITCQGSGILTISPATTFSNGATITTGGLTVTAGGATITAGGLTVTAGGATITAGALTINTSGIIAPSSLVSIPGSAGFSGNIKFGENTSNGSFTYTFGAPSSFGSNLTVTLPTTAGTSGQYLQTNGAGVTSWQTVTTGVLGTSGCLVILSGTQTINASTTGKITWNSKVYDIATEFSTVNNRFTATSTGTYLACINVSVLNSGAFGHTDTCFLYKNGSPLGYSVINFFTGVANQVIPFTFTLPVQLNATDFLEVFYQNATGSASVVIQTVSTFSVTRLY